jgi:hypothetical protein
MSHSAHPNGHARFTDPLALSAGAGARLILAGVVLAGLWGAVAWAMAL